MCVSCFISHLFALRRLRGSIDYDAIADRDTETRSMPKPVAMLKPHKVKHLIVPLSSTRAEANYGSARARYATKGLTAVSYRINTGHVVLWHVNAEHAVKFNQPKACLEFKIPPRSFEILYLTTPVCGPRLPDELEIGRVSLANLQPDEPCSSRRHLAHRAPAVYNLMRLICLTASELYKSAAYVLKIVSLSLASPNFKYNA